MSNVRINSVHWISTILVTLEHTVLMGSHCNKGKRMRSEELKIVTVILRQPGMHTPGKERYKF